MKTILFAGLALAACIGMSGCTTTNQQTMAPVVQAVADGLPRCHISGSINSGVGGIAGTGTGVAQNFTFDCPAAPVTTQLSADAAATSTTTAK
jgi:hypothetical protein